MSIRKGMTEQYEYLEVILRKEDQDYSGQISWPKSIEPLSEFIVEEWVETPLKCLNHFSSRKWAYVEGIYNRSESETRILFSRQTI